MEVFADVVLQGRRLRIPGLPIAFETQFGWVLAVSTKSRIPVPCQDITSCRVSLLTGDALLCHFWEVEEGDLSQSLSQEEKIVLDHFNTSHGRLEDGRFMVPLPKKSGTTPLGES